MMDANAIQVWGRGAVPPIPVAHHGGAVRVPIHRRWPRPCVGDLPGGAGIGGRGPPAAPHRPAAHRVQAARRQDLGDLRARPCAPGSAAATGRAGWRKLRRARRQRPGLRTARHRQGPCPVRLGPQAGAGPARRQARPSATATITKARQLRFPGAGRPGVPAPRGRRVRGALHAHRRTLRTPVPGHHVQPGLLSQWEHIFANPMATSAAIDRVVHHSVILEFDVPSYRTGVAQQRGQKQEVNRQE